MYVTQDAGKVKKKRSKEALTKDEGRGNLEKEKMEEKKRGRERKSNSGRLLEKKRKETVATIKGKKKSILANSD